MRPSRTSSGNRVKAHDAGVPEVGIACRRSRGASRGAARAHQASENFVSTLARRRSGREGSSSPGAGRGAPATTESGRSAEARRGLGPGRRRPGRREHLGRIVGVGSLEQGQTARDAGGNASTWPSPQRAWMRASRFGPWLRPTREPADSGLTAARGQGELGLLADPHVGVGQQPDQLVDRPAVHPLGQQLADLGDARVVRLVGVEDAGRSAPCRSCPSPRPSRET